VVSKTACRFAMAFRTEPDRRVLSVSVLRRLQEAGVQPLPHDAAIFGCLSRYFFLGLSTWVFSWFVEYGFLMVCGSQDRLALLRWISSLYGCCIWRFPKRVLN